MVEKEVPDQVTSDIKGGGTWLNLLGKILAKSGPSKDMPKARASSGSEEPELSLFRESISVTTSQIQVLQ